MSETKEKKESTREIEAGVLFYVDGLLKFIEDKRINEGEEMTFEEALSQNMVQFMDDDYCQMAYKTIKTLVDKGYLEGYVDLDYEDGHEDRVEYLYCTFSDIKVTEKGRKMLETDELILSLKQLMKGIKGDAEMMETDEIRLIVKNLMKKIGGNVAEGSERVLRELKAGMVEGVKATPTIVIEVLLEAFLKMPAGVK